MTLHDKIKSLPVGWRGIDEAPKDGSYVLLRQKGFTKPVIAKWKVAKSKTKDGKEYVKRQGWYNVRYSFWHDAEATHFAPLNSPEQASKLQEALLVAVEALNKVMPLTLSGPNSIISPNVAKDLMEIEAVANSALTQIEKLVAEIEEK